MDVGIEVAGVKYIVSAELAERIVKDLIAGDEEQERRKAREETRRFKDHVLENFQDFWPRPDFIEEALDGCFGKYDFGVCGDIVGYHTLSLGGIGNLELVVRLNSINSEGAPDLEFMIKDVAFAENIPEIMQDEIGQTLEGLSYDFDYGYAARFPELADVRAKLVASLQPEVTAWVEQCCAATSAVLDSEDFLELDSDPELVSDTVDSVISDCLNMGESLLSCYD